jgi:hypothetical protein
MPSQSHSSAVAFSGMNIYRDVKVAMIPRITHASARRIKLTVADPICRPDASNDSVPIAQHSTVLKAAISPMYVINYSLTSYSPACATLKRYNLAAAVCRYQSLSVAYPPLALAVVVAVSKSVLSVPSVVKKAVAVIR